LTISVGSAEEAEVDSARVAMEKGRLYEKASVQEAA
jgi:hypothetical protein